STTSSRGRTTTGSRASAEPTSPPKGGRRGPVRSRRFRLRIRLEPGANLLEMALLVLFGLREALRERVLAHLLGQGAQHGPAFVIGELRDYQRMQTLTDGGARVVQYLAEPHALDADEVCRRRHRGGVGAELLDGIREHLRMGLFLIAD